MPAAALYVGLAGAMLLVLAFRVVRLRRRHRIGIGEGGNAELARAIRVHGNFVESVPLPLIGLALLESLGYSAIAIHLLGLGLLAGRVAHAWGLTRTEMGSAGRTVGVVLTWAVTAIVAALCIAGGLQF